MIDHIKNCRARSSKCNFCDAIGHYEVVCRKKKAINELKPENGGKLEPPQSEDDEASGLYHINIFRITETSQQQATPKGRTKPRDFKAQLVVNNSLATVLADTGASISVCGKEQACKWNLLTRMINTNAKIKPYNSPTTALQYQSLELPSAQ